MPHQEKFKFMSFNSTQLSPIPSESTQTVCDERRKNREGMWEYPPTPSTSKIFLQTHTQTHTQGELFGVDGNEKKSKPFGSRRRAKAFWGCVKGVRVRICDKKWLYGSWTLKSFSFREENMCRLLVVKNLESRNWKWISGNLSFSRGK